MEGIARKPAWLRIRPPPEGYHRTREVLRAHSLETVCASARCPNVGECWGAGEATFMVLGRVCTRGCRFCAVEKGVPEAPDPTEPERLARGVEALSLRYVVITSVTRDDLPDGGAWHIAECIRAVKRTGAEVEALVPDFQGAKQALRKVLEAGPKVLAHNVEVVERLQRELRDHRAGYDSSLQLLRDAKALDPGICTKASLMLGLGENKEEVVQAMADLRAAGVDIVTLGQYLRPGPWQKEVVRYWSPEEFRELGEEGQRMGLMVSAGPLVRSSYRAALLLEG